MQESFWWSQCSVRYSLPLPTPPGISVPATTSSALNKFNQTNLKVIPCRKKVQISIWGTQHIMFLLLLLIIITIIIIIINIIIIIIIVIFLKPHFLIIVKPTMLFAGVSQPFPPTAPQAHENITIPLRPIPTVPIFCSLCNTIDPRHRV